MGVISQLINAAKPPPVPQQTRPPPQAGAVLADGSHGPTTGKVGDGKRVEWQMSGVLIQGCPSNIGITDGYTIQLGGPGTHQTDKQRQRNEFLSRQRGQAGETFLYKWNYHLVPSAELALPHAQFFHLTQLFSREQGGFVISLCLRNAKVEISTTLDSQYLKPDTPQIHACDVQRYMGRTVAHRALVTWGPRGSIDYTIRDAGSGEVLISYVVENCLVKANGSVKQGLYRAAVYCPATAFVGDFDFTQRK